MPEIYADIEGEIDTCAYCQQTKVAVFPIGKDGKSICRDCMNDPHKNKDVQEQMNLLAGFKMPPEKNN